MIKLNTDTPFTIAPADATTDPRARATTGTCRLANGGFAEREHMVPTIGREHAQLAAGPSAVESCASSVFAQHSSLCVRTNAFPLRVNGESEEKCC